MSMDVTVTVTLDAPDAKAAATFEEAFRAWARTQPMVKEVRTEPHARWNGGVWREARKAAFGSKLGNPFGRTTLEG
ncbi:hypothetical protein [Azospirillum sp.]|uniref:hypothetical protein n=1 Tax=Azospirillum sp. TaxID=34012 RepID=UPI003D764CD6